MLKILAALIIFVLPAPVFAAIYGYVDSDGVYHMTNIRPPHKNFFTLVEERDLGAENGAIALKGLKKDTYDGLIKQHSEATGVDPRLVKAVMLAESNGNPWAISRKGARGLMQIMPETGESLDLKDPFDPSENIQAGTRYLKLLHDLFRGNVELVLAAYNAGPQKVVQHNMGVPPFAETVGYVKRVKQYYDRLKDSQ
jgi:soluble lytic murein transglycosylase-like protein